VNKVFRFPVLIVMAIASLALCSSAQAALVTVGSPLTATFGGSLGTSPTGTWANSNLAEPGANATSPVNGVVIAWTIAGNYSAGKPFELRVLRPAGSGKYTGSGTSSPMTPTEGTQTFATDLPIKVGDLIGLNVNSGYIGAAGVSKSHVVDWFPELAEGSTLAPPYLSNETELGFNATVQPTPTITAIGPASGSVKGGTSVTITGTDLEGASAVSFGTVPATSFAVNSDSQITAITPASAAGAVNVAVTTIAGTATSTQQFTSTAPAATCIVPKLTGKKLKAARKAIKKADCKIGKVKKLEGATTKTGKVVKQNPKAGKVLAAGSKVNVKLGG
jgi:IPT/TIG domain/PASTA domain